MTKKNNNLVKCAVWMAAAFVCLMVLALITAGSGVYTVASILSFICMAVSMFYWVRFAMPLTNNAFRCK